MNVQIPPIIRKILAVLKLQNDNEIMHYLNPRLERLPSPMRMKGIDEAIQLILQEFDRGSEIIIWGDYDVDGTTGTALLVNFFRELGVEPHWHIPNRLVDGYGLNTEIFRNIHATRLAGKPFLLITVDCGISNYQEVEEIVALGGRVIVTDHHQLPIGDLPCCVTLNPNQDGCGFREEKLAGVGVAFYLAVAMRMALEKKGFFAEAQKPNMKDYLGFVALGTVSDLVDLTQTNRILVRAGMETLPDSGVVGLRALIESAGLNGSTLTTEDISFNLGPRINAAGRLGKADVSVELMTSDNIILGAKLSKQLELFNVQRKALCEQNLEMALEILDNNASNYGNTVVVSGVFHVGIIGIVASRLVELYRKPAIVFGCDTDHLGRKIWKGSGRSVQGIDLLECLHECAPHILKYGGHAMAAGLSIGEHAIGEFQQAFEKAAEIQRLNGLHSHEGLPMLVECSVDEVMNKETLAYLMRLEPFGPENERPVFVDPSASILSCRTIGDNGQHLQLTLRGKYENFRGVGFGLGKKRKDVLAHPTRKILFTPMLNRFRGKVDWQLRVTDI